MLIAYYCEPIINSLGYLRLGNDRNKNSLMSCGGCSKSATGQNQRLFRILLTGGPCGGKSSSLELLKKEFPEFNIVCVPEIPTIIMSSGVSFPGLDAGEKLVEFEINVLRLQLQMEDSFTNIAKSTGKPTLVIFDRGAPDIGAYIPAQDYDRVLQMAGVTHSELLGRYDLVLHLVTAAAGAESFYTTDNNVARIETAEEARALDTKILSCYADHPRHAILDNSTGFEGKIQRAGSSVRGLLQGHGFYRTSCSGCGCGACGTGDCSCVKTCEPEPCVNESCKFSHCICGTSCTCGVSGDVNCNPCVKFKKQKMAEQAAAAKAGEA